MESKHGVVLHPNDRLLTNSSGLLWRRSHGTDGLSWEHLDETHPLSRRHCCHWNASLFRLSVRFFHPIKIASEMFFVSLRYPLFLNIENHCSYGQQGVMASVLRETFKGKWPVLFSELQSMIIDHLLTEPLVDNFQTLPSPEDLKYKIIVRVGISVEYRTAWDWDWSIFARAVDIPKERPPQIQRRIGATMKQNRILR